MRLDSISNQVYTVAVNEARLQNHEYITPEHFLYAAMMFDIGKEIIEGSGGNVRDITNNLQDFFMEKMTQTRSESPVDSYGLVKMFEMASHQAQMSNKETITLGDLLVAMLDLQESFGVYILLKNGVERLALLKFISHSVKKETKPKEKNFLQEYAVNLTEKAELGQLDPLIGREDILERTIHVLCRRLKNNPVHVGEPGVGKTAIVEGLAQLIAAGDVPDRLKKAKIFYVDMGTVVAGTRYRGDFEERLLKILDEISKHECPIVYFDEIHTLVGAGGTAGSTMDATGILKPYLAKGELRFIGSTTFDDYKKSLERDKALVRRFQRIDVNEPSVSESVDILKGIKQRYEEYHGVIIPDEVIEFICRLAGSQLHDRFLPDKAIDLMDEAAAYTQIINKSDRVVDTDSVELIFSKIAKVPRESVSANETDLLRNLDTSLKNTIFGQDDAIDKVTAAIRLSRSGLKDGGKPVASLLFVGPTGVGKTELATQLAKGLGVGLVRYDMTEYQEGHSVARLIGSPPGYVGYDEGGMLTEAIRKTPHCVLLLDEIEKAHSDIQNVLLQIMDYGRLTDNMGKQADFSNVILIMTSNAGAREMGKKIIGFEDRTYQGEAVNKEVLRVFSPEFRNRLDDIVLFNPISEKMARSITSKALDQLAEKLRDKSVALTVRASAFNFIASKGLSEMYGAREIIRLVNTRVKNLLVDEILFGQLKNGGHAVIAFRNGKIYLKAK